MKKITNLASGLLLATAMAVGSTPIYAQEVEEQTPSNGISFPSQTSTYSPRRTVRVDDAVIGDSKAFTISAWVYIDASSDGQFSYSNYPLFGLTNINSYGVTTNTDVCLESGAFTMKVNSTMYGTAKPGTLVEGASNSGTRQTWAHLALAVDDEAGQAQLYLNGTMVQTYEFTPGIVFRAGEDLIFHITNAYNYASIATRFDDLKIANRVLTTEEIANLEYAYQEDNVPDYIAGYYSFDETTGTVNEYPNLGHGGAEYKAQVQEGTSGYSGYEFNGTLSTTDSTGEGIVNNWAPYSYTVTVTTEGEGSVKLTDENEAEVASGSSVAKGTVLNIEATPADNYKLSSITVNGSALESLENPTVTVDAATEINVVFAIKTSQIAADSGTSDGGSYIVANPETDQEFEKSEGYYTLDYGTEAKVIATANEGWRLTGITLNDGTADTQLNIENPVFTVAADSYTITAAYVEQFAVTYSATEGGSLAVAAGESGIESGSLLDNGTEITVTATAEDGYALDKLTVNGEAVETTDGVYTFTLEADTEIAAEFVAMYSVSFSATEGGSITVATADGEIASGDELKEGTEITVTATADEKYSLDKLTVNGEEVELTDGAYTFTLEADTEITAEFAENEGGVAQLEAGFARYDSGSQSIRANGDAEISVFSIDGKEILSAKGSELSVAGLSKGLYIAIVSDGQTVEKIKFCK